MRKELGTRFAMSEFYINTQSAASSIQSIEKQSKGLAEIGEDIGKINDTLAIGGDEGIEISRALREVIIKVYDDSRSEQILAEKFGEIVGLYIQNENNLINNYIET